MQRYTKKWNKIQYIQCFSYFLHIANWTAAHNNRTKMHYGSSMWNPRASWPSSLLHFWDGKWTHHPTKFQGLRGLSSKGLRTNEVCKCEHLNEGSEGHGADCFLSLSFWAKADFLFSSFRRHNFGIYLFVCSSFQISQLVGNGASWQWQSKGHP